VRLTDFRLRKGERFDYEYDFGDYWQYDLRLEQVLPLVGRTRFPACTAGSGACPPEDDADRATTAGHYTPDCKSSVALLALTKGD
jgi:hypothetical protein